MTTPNFADISKTLGTHAYRLIRRIRKTRLSEVWLALDTLLELLKPKPAWLRLIEQIFQGMILRELQRSATPVRTQGVPSWIATFVRPFLVLLFPLVVILGVPRLSALPLISSPTNASVTPTITATAAASPPGTFSVLPTISTTAAKALAASPSATATGGTTDH
jgi:hypothetical protein